MQILFFSWGENSADDLCSVLLTLGHTVHKLQTFLKNYLADSTLLDTLNAQLEKHTYDLIFSFNYIPLVSEAAQSHRIKYVSWVYDCPHWTLYSPTLTNCCNYLFLFDLEITDKVKSLGALHAYHLPLACHTSRISRQLHLSDTAGPEYMHDISFVGTLYERSPYSRIQYLPDTLRGYLDGIMTAQKQIWGYNLIKELLTPDKIRELQIYLKLDSDPSCPIPPKDLFQNLLLTKITSDERIEYLNTIARTFETVLYSGSDPGLCPAVIHKGTISYTEQMPDVFYRSRINLNISLRSITSGIPLRALDIMGCGGFLLTNYQPELAEFFEPDREFVYYEDLADLIKKADFYLAHEQERMQIARAGCEKVKSQFSYEQQLSKIFTVLQGC